MKGTRHRFHYVNLSTQAPEKRKVCGTHGAQETSGHQTIRRESERFFLKGASSGRKKGRKWKLRERKKKRLPPKRTQIEKNVLAGPLEQPVQNKTSDKRLPGQGEAGCS